MSIQQLFKSTTKNFFSNFYLYLLLFFSIDTMLFGAVTLFNYLASLILKFQGIPYISYTNLDVFLKKPLATLLLLGLFIVLLFTVFFQFSFLLLGVRQIYQQQFNLAKLLKESFYAIGKQTWQGFLFFLFYFLLVLPFSNEIFHTKLLNKMVIPVFITEFLATNIMYILLLVVAGLLIGYIAIRLIFVLPLVILGNHSPKEAIDKSLLITKRQFWYFSWYIFILTSLSVALKYVVFFLLYLAQLALDLLPNPYALIGAIFNLSLVQITDILFSSWTSVLLLSLLIIYSETAFFVAPKKENKKTSSPHWFTFIKITSLMSLVIAIVTFNGFFLNGLIQQKPKLISHRGVDSLENPNGVQNTIPSLVKTMSLNPDLIEIDIQETKDGQFIMMHDPNFKNLTGIDGTPQQFTLEELTSMTVREHDLEAKMASFDDYLEVANEGNQKLLIEIKTSKEDSSALISHFIKRYKQTILDNKHEVQSLDYDAVQELKAKAPEIPVSYILPYNFIFPNTDLNTYTMEATTLNDQFLIKAHALNQTVYAWTINDEKTMDKMMFMNVDGIITDELSVLKQEVISFQESSSYAHRILNYISVTSNLDSL